MHVRDKQAGRAARSETYRLSLKTNTAGDDALARGLITSLRQLQLFSCFNPWPAWSFLGTDVPLRSRVCRDVQKQPRGTQQGSRVPVTIGERKDDEKGRVRKADRAARRVAPLLSRQRGRERVAS